MENCDKCATQFDLDDDYRVAIELDCAHNICSRCFAIEKSVDIEANSSLICPICNNVTKFSAAYKKAIKQARITLESRKALKCAVHNEKILYICSNDGRFLCIKCVAQAKPPLKSDSLVVYRKDTACFLAKALLGKLQQKFTTVENTLKKFDQQIICPAEDLLNSVRFSSDLFSIEDISNLEYDSQMILQALTN